MWVGGGGGGMDEGDLRPPSPGPSAYACCGKEQPNNIANLPKYAVHATKPPAPESPRTASLKQMLVLCLATILYC